MDKTNYQLNNQNSSNNFDKGIKDLFSSIKSWRIFCLMGIIDIRKRYIRSKLGQFWLTLSLAINIFTLGIIWGNLFKISTDDYLPYLAFSTIFWTFMSANINEGAPIYINYTSFLKELTIGKSAYIFSLFIKNLIILAHNLLIIIPLAFFCNFYFSATAIILCLISIILTVLFLIPVVMIISVISLRFRDIPNIIISLMQIIFYATPIMWKIESLSMKYKKLLILNPFNIFISLCRDPFITGTASPILYWQIAALYIVLSWLIGFNLFCKYRDKIIYWL